MKKTILAAAVTLSLCVPAYAAGQFFNDDSEKYDAPVFADNAESFFSKDMRGYRRSPKYREDKALQAQIKEDKKAQVNPIRLQADHAEYDPTSGDFHASGNVVIRQGLQTITTSYANGNMKSGDIWIQEGAQIKEAAMKLEGKWGHYNINSKTGELKEVSGKSNKDFVKADHAIVLPDKVVLDQGGSATRCPSVKHPPCMSVEAKVIEYYPGEKIIAHDVKVLVRGKHIYSRNIWINEFNGGAQTRIFPRIGHDGSERGAYIKLEVEQHLDKKNSVNMELVKYDKAGYKPQYGFKHEERNFRLKYFYGWDEDDDIWYHKQNDFRLDYKPHHIVKGLPISYSGYYERGLWSRERKSLKSWHSEYAYFINHDPIYLFNSKNTVFNASFGQKWVHESATDETNKTDMYFYTLGQRINRNLKTWVGYYKQKRTTNLFALGQPDMDEEVRNGIQYALDKNNVFTVVNRYDYGKHKQYETDYRWFHKFCCWALEISYEKKWYKDDHNLKLHYYFFNW